MLRRGPGWNEVQEGGTLVGVAVSAVVGEAVGAIVVGEAVGAEEGGGLQKQC